MKELTLDATVENLQTVIAFVEEQLQAADCPMKIQMQISIAVDELFSNVAHYAYGDKVGPITVYVDIQSAPRAATITFVDKGTPYNPLERADPDITLSADERKIGGLGIYMVKKSMNDVRYTYQNGQNILTIQKNY